MNPDIGIVEGAFLVTITRSEVITGKRCRTRLTIGKSPTVGFRRNKYQIKTVPIGESFKLKIPVGMLDGQIVEVTVGESEFTLVVNGKFQGRIHALETSLMRFGRFSRIKS